MGEAAAERAGALGGHPDAVHPGTAPLDVRRRLQLALAGLWVLDAVLQYQPAMFTRAFAAMLAGSAQGNAPLLARPITWSAGLVLAHGAALNALFATIQLAIGLGIAIRPTVRPALAGSIAWALAVWWLGEGFGGVFAGTASPVTGAPGAAVLYILLAVLLWPSRAAGSFAAASAVGLRAARALWLVLWLGMACYAVTPANRAPQALSGAIASMGGGEPGWLAAVERGAAAIAAGHGLAGSVLLAVALAVIAVGVYLPRRACQAALLLAVAVSLVIWVVGEAFGMIMAGGATDPNTGPPLVLLAVAYWPACLPGVAAQRAGALGPWCGNAAASDPVAGR